MEAPVFGTSEWDTLVEGALLFAIVWGVGGALDSDGRAAFDALLRLMLVPDPTSGTGAEDARALLAQLGALGVSDLITAGLVPAEPLANADVAARRLSVEQPTFGRGGASWFEFVFSLPGRAFVPWMDDAEAGPGDWSIPEGASFHSITVPTVAGVSTGYLLKHAVAARAPMLITGVTGTGKSVMVHQTLSSLSDEAYAFVPLTFSAQTSVNQTQDIIDGRMDKRRRGVYGPPLGRRAVVFVDDLNMPALEQYGAQPPIELLRQWHASGGWYSRSTNSFMRITDTQFVAAMGPPGGGRNVVCSRLLRYFNVLTLPALADDELRRIFLPMLQWHLGPAAASVRGMADAVVTAMLDVYARVSADLLPTPAKSHYLFNLRDLASVVQGLLQLDPAKISDASELTAAWAHETQRVFGDRLVDETDRSWLDQALADVTQDTFKTPIRDVAPPDAPLMFSTLLSEAEPRAYQRVADYDRLQAAVTEALEDYNGIAKSPMDLVLFRFAVEHVARIVRIISRPKGNALLVGVGGSGRQSLSRLAAFCVDFDVVQVEVSAAYGRTEWLEDLKAVFMTAGVEGKPVVFLLSDAQLVDADGMLEDVSNILNTGQVPNLWAPDETQAILERLQKPAVEAGAPRADTRDGVLDYFVQRCRDNVHIILCLSPVGSEFRERLRKFPSLVSCSTIDWFSAWPSEALHSVADRFIADTALPEEQRTKVARLCVSMHSSVQAAAELCFRETGRRLYVTATSFLELLTTYRRVVASRRTAVEQQRLRYDRGLEKLAFTAEQVEAMTAEQTELKPVLQRTQAETDALMAEIKVKEAAAAAVKRVLVQEEAQAQTQADAAERIKVECEGDLAKALPALEAAVKALKALKKSDVSEVKVMTNPPDGVRLVMSAVCVMFAIKPATVKDDKGNKTKDYWPAAKKLLSQSSFLSSLLSFDKDGITQPMVDELHPFLDDPTFTPAAILKVSCAASGLCAWVRAMAAYYEISRDVAPKRAALADAQAQLAETEAVLSEKRASLQATMDELAALQANFESAVSKKDLLQAQYTQCVARLDRAQELMRGLGGERARWSDAVTALAVQFDNVVGDVVIVAGCISYLGAFTGLYRDQLRAKWQAAVLAEGLPTSGTAAQPVTLETVLGNAVRIRDWHISGLPRDALSVENALVIENARRWPLCVDPQGQAAGWIEKMEAVRQIRLVKAGDGDLVRSLQNAVRFGTPLLLLDVGEELDPALESLLQRATFKQGNTTMIRIGDQTVEYSDGFKLYLCTKLPNPTYSPETSTRVSLLNFAITADGLADQLLGTTVRREQSELEERRERLVLETAANRKELARLEDEVLRLLSESEGNILDDQALISTLSSSQATSADVKSRVAVADRTATKINAVRAQYVPAAKRAAALFFCCADMALVDPMYQSSLGWFQRLFVATIDATPSRPGVSIADRVADLNAAFTRCVYTNMCRALFSRHKLVFSLLMTARLDLLGGVLDPAVMRLVCGGVPVLAAAVEANPLPAAIDDAAWAELCNAQKVSACFAPLPADIAARPEVWQAWLAAPQPQLPAPFAKLGAYPTLAVRRILSPETAVDAITEHISAVLGPEYTAPPAFDLAAAFEDGTCADPFIFVTSPGADPVARLLAFAEDRGMTGAKFATVSLGQGQGPIATRLINEGIERGHFVCLQNCHLALSWLPELELICERLRTVRVNPAFRLFLTSLPTPAFPVSVLQNAVKVTFEPPRGLRANVERAYSFLPPGYLEDFQPESASPEHAPEVIESFRRLQFSLTLFHAVLLERARYGPLGWNNAYDFSDSDLRISQQQLRMMMTEAPSVDHIPWAALTSITGGVNYGGRVSDDQDRRTLLTLLGAFFNTSVAGDPGYSYSPSGLYAPPVTALLPGIGAGASLAAATLAYTRQLPAVEAPEIFGLHANAQIAYSRQECSALLATTLSLTSRDRAPAEHPDGKAKEVPAAGPENAPAPAAAADGDTDASGDGPEDNADDALVVDLCQSILAQLPAPFDMERVSAKYPTDYSQSFNTVLTQDAARYNALLNVVARSLEQLQLAVKGTVVMSAEYEAVYAALREGRVPAVWARAAYPSTKPLGAWVANLVDRLAFIARWIEHGNPSVYPLPYLYFTQAFLTGTLQNYARQHTVPIDEVSWAFVVLRETEAELSARPPPETGAYVSGLFIEAASWNAERGCLDDSLDRVLFSSFPVLWLRPTHPDVDKEPVEYEGSDDHGRIYAFDCPLYRTPERRGVLTTTGHSTNFVCRVTLRASQPATFWVKRGTALLCSLST
jgi:dynein heavy chain